MAGSLAKPVDESSKDKEPLKKVNKYPKKYDKTIDEVQKKKDDPKSSSYLSYDKTGGPLEPLQPPPLFYGDLRLIDPIRGMSAPPEDTYFNHDATPIDVMVPPPPQDDAGYSYVKVEDQTGDGVALEPPQLSSYADEVAEGAAPSKNYAVGLRAPVTGVELLEDGSSYVSLDSMPKVSSYVRYSGETVPMEGRIPSLL